MNRPAAGTKLRFSVAHATGETRGWQCARFSKFPQELILRLDHPARIHQIQLLSHEYKIATKIELYTGLLPPGETSMDRAIMRRLGHLSFDPNTASGHQARELKSVHVNVDAAILRVVVHKCHVNKLNIYNQVGIVAINVIGEAISPTDPGWGGAGGNLAPGPRPARGAGMADMAIDLDVDPVTAVKIREIHALKDEAVAREDYDEAKRLRDGINRLKAVGAKIGQLEARKRAAVEAEDYEAAKLIKLEIDKLRDAGGVTALGESVGAGSGRARRGEDDEAIFAHVLQANREIIDRPPVDLIQPGGRAPAPDLGDLESPAPEYGGGGAVREEYEHPPAPPSPPPPPPPPRESDTTYGAQTQPEAYEPRREYEAPTREMARMSHDERVVGGLSPAQLAAIKANAGPDDIPPPVSQGYSAMGNYDERPAVSRTAMEMAKQEGSTPQRFRDGPDASAKGFNNDEVPAGATGRSRMPAGLEDEEFVPPVGSVRSPGNAKPPEGYDPDLPPPDPIPSAFTTEAGPVVDAFGEYAAMCLYSKNWMHREAALARMEEQVRQGAVNADTREVFRTMCNMMTRLFKDKVANVFANACKLLTSAVKVMGKELGGREVHSSVAQLVPQLIEKLGDAHAKVRDASREAILELASSDLTLVSGPLVKPVRSQSVWRIVLGRLSIMNELIPKHGLAKAGHDGLTLEAVMEFTSKTFESPNGDVRSAAVKVTLECCNIAGRAVEKFLPKNLKPAIRDIIDEGLGVKTGAGGGGGGGARKSAATPGKGKAPPPNAGQRAPAPVGGGNPTARELKAEIAAREKELGKQHPDVAVALTDLAALHSEEEQFAAAQPLYERALRIQEKTLGSEHQDTVQTLTDLAICHLDQGHNEVGRPLLERALVLQEQALGPDHADVVAIRDVLQSLDADDGM
ncbi:predicted protein [Micromonas commoda]|uniref:TOG domain-containing protein n=1 Tax=Micromonas commoda (strain RCC299 / NOUM17 / CCMP2709) TaxID=296587 RepID=C1FGT1_MICCC|nr:predicted protein [Micromonas commoda]ACO69597.1 predicted protein [Micromonas commoda]|eukprot:XP_002508339.1 predicted protein [Micromonas commoda]